MTIITLASQRQFWHVEWSQQPLFIVLSLYSPVVSGTCPGHLHAHGSSCVPWLCWSPQNLFPDWVSETLPTFCLLQSLRARLELWRGPTLNPRTSNSSTLTSLTLPSIQNSDDFKWQKPNVNQLTCEGEFIVSWKPVQESSCIIPQGPLETLSQTSFSECLISVPSAHI